MKTNFFNHIEAMKCPGKWQIIIHTDNKGAFTVSTHFTAGTSGDNAGKNIIPFVATGTATDFDEGYFSQIEKPIRETSGLLSNMEDCLKGLSKAKEQSRMVQDTKNKNKAKPDGAKDGVELPGLAAIEEKRKAYTEALRKVIELESLCRYDEALAELPLVADYPDKEAEITKRKTELERKRQQKANLLFT